MSAPKSYLPMLNGLMLGEAMSSHDGVCCYPAIRHSNQEKYILKVISVPASQVQLDALLLTGAFPNREAAMEYYMDVSRDMLRETEILRQLSHQEGFIPYLDGQIITNDTLNGYEVYLLSSFKLSVERIFETETLTHKQIFRMGLDLCAALAACRRDGYIYVDLKPANVFYSEEQGYKIGDVGFASIASLPYSSLPEKYRSPYTAPELLDEMAVLNSTVDVYALGLMLYQAYNGGLLPELEDGSPLPTPLYADYEFADIILKACHHDPSQRWKDPMELAQAIIAYIQANPISNESIIPVVPEEEPPQPDQVEEFLPEADPEELRKEISALTGTEYEEMAFVSELGSSSSEADSDGEAIANMELSEEITEMLAQADDLIAHELPEPAVAPEPIDVPMPERICLDPEEDEDTPPEPEKESSLDETPEAPIPEPEPKPEAVSEVAPESEVAKKEKPILPRRPIPWRTLVAVCLTIALLSVAFGGYYFYQHYYLQTIDDLILDHKGDLLSVKVVSSVDNSLLTVVCSDSYGNTQRQSVVAGIALFQGLDPQTHYSVRLDIAGFHKLVGITSSSFTTAPQTQITYLAAEIGSEDGTVLICFETDGPETDKWVISYSTLGNENNRIQVPFQGYSVEIMDLEIGLEYTFTLSRADGQAVSGTTQVQFTGQKILLAQEPTITACGNGSLTVQWQAPEEAQNVIWNVRCYNSSGYSQNLTTEVLTATFTGLTHDVPCTVEIMAEGMPKTVTITAPSDPITVEQFHFTESEDGMLSLTWDFSGNAPEKGWTLEYTVDNQAQPVLNLSENNAMLLLVPGANYTIQVKAVEASMQFGGNCSYSCPQAPRLDRWGITAADLQGALCVRPELDGWTAQDVDETMYTTVFTKGQNAGLVLTTQTSPEQSDEIAVIRFVIRDSAGNLICMVSTELTWSQLWNENSCALNIPELPEGTGGYSVDVYFSGQHVGQWTFSLQESE